jgi:hypothetical protein
MECEHCKNKFSSISSLNNHIKNARYCLKKRGSKNPTTFLCCGCKRSFSSKNFLVIHSQTCLEVVKQKYERVMKKNKNQYEKTIQEHKEHIQVLEQRLENVAIQAVSRPTTQKNTQINNYIQKLECVTDEHLSEQSGNLRIDHVQRGPEGYADYALEYPLKNRIVCVDYARRKVKFKDSEGNIITDPEMGSVATKLFQSIKDKNKDLIMTYGNELKDRFGDEMDMVVKLLEYKSSVDSGSEGSKTDFYHDFVKSVCSKTIPE